MERARRRLVAPILLVVASVLVAVGSAHSASAEPAPVVSYLVSAGADSDAWLPDDPGYWFRVSPHEWHWHLFDPASGRDTIFLKLSSFPLLIRWDPHYTHVEFIEGARVQHVAWQLGGKKETVATLPVDSAYCDFWRDPAGRFWLDTGVMATVRRWRQDAARKWHVTGVDSPTVDLCVSETLGPKDAGQTVTNTALLYTMLIGNYKDSPLTDADTLSAWVPSTFDPSVGLGLETSVGDTYHANEPVVWMDRKTGRSRTLYARGQSHDEAAGQVGFAERRDFVLITAEYSGAYPAVANMRTGKTILRVDRPSARAVWVPAPEGWR